MHYREGNAPAVSHLVGLGRVLKVGALHDGVDRARLLAEPAEDALCHVNVVAGGAAREIRGSVVDAARLGLDGDGLRRADGFAQLACNAALLAAWIPAPTSSRAGAGSVIMLQE